MKSKGRAATNEVAPVHEKVFKRVDDKPAGLVLSVAGNHRRVFNHLYAAYRIQYLELEMLLSLHFVLTCKRRKCIGIHSFIIDYGISRYRRNRTLKRLHGMVTNGFLSGQEGKTRTPGTTKAVPYYIGVSQVGEQIIREYERMSLEVLAAGIAHLGHVDIVHGGDVFATLADIPDEVMPISAEDRIRYRKAG